MSEGVVWVAALPAWALRSPRGTRRSIRCSRNALREDKTEYENGVAIVSTHRLLWLREHTLLAVPLSTIANVSVVVWHMALPPLPSSPALALALALARPASGPASAPDQTCFWSYTDGNAGAPDEPVAQAGDCV